MLHFSLRKNIDEIDTPTYIRAAINEANLFLQRDEEFSVTLTFNENDIQPLKYFTNMTLLNSRATDATNQKNIEKLLEYDKVAADIVGANSNELVLFLTYDEAELGITGLAHIGSLCRTQNIQQLQSTRV